MTWIRNWDEFSPSVKDLFLAHPQTRYVLKYSHKKQTLQVKVTDDRTCLKFRTDTADDLKRIDKLTNWFMRRMAADTYQDAQDN